jgi:hypothetical protein
MTENAAARSWLRYNKTARSLEPARRLNFETLPIS